MKAAAQARAGAYKPVVWHTDDVLEEIPICIEESTALGARIKEFLPSFSGAEGGCFHEVEHAVAFSRNVIRERGAWREKDIDRIRESQERIFSLCR